jgi:hypothetical protein
MTFGIDCYMGIDDHWKNPSVQLWHPTAGTLAHVPVPQFSLAAMSAADEEAQEYRRRFGFEYGNYDIERLCRPFDSADSRAHDAYIELVDARYELMRSWACMYEPLPAGEYGTSALEDGLEEQLTEEANRHIAGNSELQGALSEHQFKRVLWVDGVDLSGEPEYSPDGVFSHPARIQVTNTVYGSH